MKRREAAAIVLAVSSLLGATACSRGSGQERLPQPAPIATPDSRPIAPPASQPKLPKPGLAYPLPARQVQDWPSLVWTGYDRGTQAHFNYDYNSAGQLALGLYAADTFDGQPLPEVRGNATPVLYFGCKAGSLMQIDNGYFTHVVIGPDAPFCQPVKGAKTAEPKPSQAILPDPQKLYVNGDQIFHVTHNLGTGD